MAAVGGQVINGKARPVAFGRPRGACAASFDLQRLVRVQHRGSVVQVRGRPWMPGVRGIHHHDTGVLLQRIIIRCIVGAVIEVRRPILRTRSFTLELAHEFQIAVVAAFGIAALTFLTAWSDLAIRFRSNPNDHNWLWAPVPSMGSRT